MRIILSLCLSLTGLAMTSNSLAERISAGEERALSAFSENKSRQFDFWIGVWDVNLRTVQDDLGFADAVSARAHIYSILGGRAILELWDAKAIKGYSLRYYEANSDEWVLWLNWPGRNSSNLSSLRGGFRHGRGEFRSEYENAGGVSIVERYAFTDISPFSLRWDDLSSNDGGKTWSKNWRMEFSRTALDPVWPIPRPNVPTYTDGSRCDDGNFRPYERIVGSWRGDYDGDPATFDAYRVLDGCAVMAFLDVAPNAGKSRFLMLTFDTANERWETALLGAEPDSGLIRYVSDDDWKEGQTDKGSIRWDMTSDRFTLQRRFAGADGQATTEVGQFTR